MAGIYIHIPFCRQACTYCNFYFSTSLKQKETFLSALHREILISQDFIANSETIDTIYFGGGTPSLLKKEELKTIILLIRQQFTLNNQVEITLEANPDDINDSIVSDWIDMGINRLSVGIQSFSEAELKWMNRAHNATESLKSIDIIRNAGIENFSVDLIFGSPLLSDDELKQNATILIEKNIPHISCYALTVEPKTTLHHLVKTNQSAPIDAEKQARQFLILSDLLESAGYEHYEISNYAKPDMRSKHNSSYWKGKPYHGFGPSAHSYNGKNKRRWNIANNALYIDQILKETTFFEEEILTESQQINEHIMISIRTAEGIHLETVEQKFGREKADTLLKKCAGLIESKKINIKNNIITLTKEGKLFADGVAIELFF